jgi:hypothetical protein
MNWVQGAYEKKEAAALAITRPKIIVAAGSSVHFGINAEMIQQALHRPTVNFGVMALLDLDYIINRLQRVLKKNDIVILPLEYEHYSYDPRNSYSSQRVYHLLTFDQYFFQTQVPLIQKICTLYGIHPLMFISSFYEQLRAKSTNFHASGSYHLEKINAFGDETNQNVHTVSVSPGLTMPTTTPESLTLLKDFQAWCHQRSIQLYLTFPNVPYFQEYAQPKMQKSMDHFRETLKQNGFEVIGHPQDAMVDPLLMFDTGYHLTPEGIKKRTMRLIELLKEMNVVPSVLAGKES